MTLVESSGVLQGEREFWIRLYVEMKWIEQQTGKLKIRSWRVASIDSLYSDTSTTRWTYHTLKFLRYINLLSRAFVKYSADSKSFVDCIGVSQGHHLPPVTQHGPPMGPVNVCIRLSIYRIYIALDLQDSYSDQKREVLRSLWKEIAGSCGREHRLEERLFKTEEPTIEKSLFCVVAGWEGGTT